MSETHDLRARLEALEAEVERLRRESAAIRTAAAAGHRGAEARAVPREPLQPLTKLAEAVGVLVTGQSGAAPIPGSVLESRTVAPAGTHRGHGESGDREADASAEQGQG
ncbi:hypothetical protein [Kitasatospora sp. HPMI-4]|uniref:hypothetical protein n=1 Tax=Kitasatospora sp. HPMI-4 TaxID=3448443 RepID=UPI003F19EB3D